MGGLGAGRDAWVRYEYLVGRDDDGKSYHTPKAGSSWFCTVL